MLERPSAVLQTGTSARCIWWAFHELHFWSATEPWGWAQRLAALSAAADISAISANSKCTDFVKKKVGRSVFEPL